MAHASLQVCMDTSDWLEGTMSEEISSAGVGLDSGGGTASECMLAAAACSSRVGVGVGLPLMERRVRPPLDHNLVCPRCDSTHTKFCYYNNYSLSQPRYFCKTCRRYWTKGGTLRNIPVGGGCRKTNKKSSNSKRSNIIVDPHHHHHHPGIISQGGGGLGLVSRNVNDLQLYSFPEVQFPPHLAHLIGSQMSLGGGSFMENGFIRPIDFMESEYDFMGGGGATNTNGDGSQEFGVMGGIGDYRLGTNYGLTSHFGGININSSTSQYNHDGNLGISFMDQRMLLPYDGNDNVFVDVKPNPMILSLECQDQGCNSNVGVADNGEESSYECTLNGGSNWTATMGGYQSTTTNSLA